MPANNPFASKAIRVNEETVGVVGKSYPTSRYSDFVARFPTICFFVGLILPVVFTFLATSSVTEVDVSIAGFEANPHESTTSSHIIQQALESWQKIISGTDKLRAQLPSQGTRIQPKYHQELRFTVNLVNLQAYCIKQGISAKNCWAQGNLLLEDNLRFVQRIEYYMQGSAAFRSICFTNNLKYGVPQIDTPTCTPIPSVTQYFFPGPYSMTSSAVTWGLTGQGTVYNYPFDDVVTRMLSTPGIEWFVDTNFSTLNRYTRSLRTQITIGSPTATVLGETRSIRAFVTRAQEILDQFPHQYIDVVFGGDQVEDAKTLRALDRDSYKVAIVFLIVFVMAFVHTRTIIISLCILIHVVLVYMAAWGFYVTAYSEHDALTTRQSMPVFSTVTILVVVSFTLHGAFAFYDTFVHSGIMSTTGRQNFLTLSQRIAFTMRRSSAGTTLANSIAILICCASLSSAFRSVRDFSVMMIFTLLFNMYCVWTIAPAYTLWHHYHFSRRRRLAQKKREILRERSDDLRRTHGVARLLEDVQSNLVPGEEMFISAMEKEGMLETLEDERAKTFIENGAMALISDTRREIDNLIATVKKSREEDNNAAVNGEKKDERSMRRVVAADVDGPSAPGFDESVFTDANNVDAQTYRRYVSDRMVNVLDIVHVPEDLTLRSVDNLQNVAQLAQDEVSARNGEGPRGEAPEATLASRRMMNLPTHFPTAQDAQSFFEFWEAAATQIGLRALPIRARATVAPSTSNPDERTTESQLVLTQHVQPIVPLMTFQWACTHDPTWFVSEVHDTPLGGSMSRRGGRPPTAPDGEGRGNNAGYNVDRNREAHGQRQTNKARKALKPDANYKGFFSRMRHRWRVRNTEQRQYLCGMIGKRVNESQDERDARILAGVARAEGYGRAERLIINFIAPFINKFRYILIFLFVILFAVAIGVSTQVKSAGVPFTLLTDTTSATTYNRMGYLYGLQQLTSNDFGGLYYRERDEFRLPSVYDVTVCGLQLKSGQMYMFLDQCLHCGGSNICLGCDNVPNSGMVRTSCGGCAASEAACKECHSYATCSWCEKHSLGVAGSGGRYCDKVCTPTATSCPVGRGSCNPYTGMCNCYNNRTMGFTGDLCSSCAPGWVPFFSTCNIECTSFQSAHFCTCRDFKCTMCPTERWGWDCSQDTMMCVHGSQIPLTQTCACDAGYEDGNLCQYHRNCSYRGILYDTDAGSPVACGCIGNWMGPDCNVCGCRNGGNCNAKGECQCYPGYSGVSCQVCAADCVTHGVCPNAIPITEYNLRACIPANCLLSEVDNGMVCPECANILWPPGGSCSTKLDRTSCMADLSCYWLSGNCVNETNPQRGLNVSEGKCRCFGAWQGDHCDTCAAPRGATCMRNGNVIACDKFEYSDAALAPAIDACGICGGAGHCVGCDGIPNSNKRYDSCGVCGGNDACLAATGAAPLEITFWMDVAGLSFTQQLESVSAACEVISAEGATPGLNIITSYAACVVRDYHMSLVSNKTIRGLFDFADLTGQLSQTGFNVFDETASNLALQFVAVKVTVSALTTDSNADLYDTYERMLSYAERMKENSGLTVRQTSPMWTNVVAAHVAMMSVRFTAGVGIAILFGLVSAVFGSIRLGFFTAIMAVFVLCATLAGASTQGWDIDSVMQVLIASIVSVAAEHAVHLLDGYQDFLQSTQSHMFAVTTTRMHAFRGALTRTGLSIFTSAITVILICLPYVFSEVQPYRRAAQVIISVHFIALIASIFFGAKLCAWGPLVVFRELGVTVVMCCVCLTLAGVIVLILYLAGGVMGPAGSKVP